MHECAECLSTEENPYSTSLCKSHQIELLMALLKDEEKWSEHYFKAWQNAQQSVHPTLGIRRFLQALSKPQPNPHLKPNPRPPTAHANR